MKRTDPWDKRWFTMFTGVLLVLLIPIALQGTGAVAGEETEVDQEKIQEKFPENTWVPINWELKIREGALPSGFDQDQGRYRKNHWYGGMTYREKSGEALIMDGYFGSSDSLLGRINIYANGVFGLNPMTETYQLYKVSNYKDGAHPTKLNLKEPTPAPRHTYENFVYVPKTDSLYIWSGANKDTGYGAKEHVREKNKKHTKVKKWVTEKGKKILGMWVYSFEKHRWRPITDSKTYPPHEYEQAMVHVPGTGRIWLVGMRGDIWSFDLETEQWRDEEKDMKWDRYMSTTFVDTKRNRIVCYSGRGSQKGQRGQKPKDMGCTIGVYDVETGEYKLIKGKGPRPAARKNSGMCYHPKHDLYIAFGGSGKELTDNWVFDPETNRWRQFKPEQNIPEDKKGQSFVDMVYDQKRNLIILSREVDRKYNHDGSGEWFAMRFDPETVEWVK